MKHMIVLLVAVLLIVPSAAMASKQTVSVNNGPAVRNIGGSWQGIDVHVQSLATNAIDTVNVSGVMDIKVDEMIPLAADSTQASLQSSWTMYVGFEGSAGTGGSGTVDSMQVAMDVSNDGRNWTQAQALTLFTNAAPVNSFWTKFRSTAGKGLETVPPFIRLRCKNTGAATGRGYVTVTWRTE